MNKIPDKFNILYISDFQSDLETINNDLIKESSKFNLRKIAAENGFIKSLNFQWDLVIADYNPKTVTAINFLNANQKEIPFIFLSDINDEKIASGAIRLGATDFILRSNLSYLIYSIKREFRCWEIKKEKKEISDELFKSKLIESELKNSGKKYKDIFEFAPVGIYEAYPDGEIIMANRALAELLGFKCPEELIGKNIKCFFTNEDDRSKLIFHAERYGEFQKKVIQWRKKDVSLITVEISGHIVKADNFTVYHEAFVRDISEEKKAEKALMDSQNRLKDLAELLPQTIFESDYFGRLTFANMRGLDLFGYTKEELKYKNIFDLIIPSERERAKRNLILKYNGEKSEISEYTALKKDGTSFPCEIYSTPIYIDNKVSGLRGILIDITEQKKILGDLLKAKEKAEEANRLKTVFLSSMSHEIRTPLNAIMGIVEIFKDEYYANASDDIKELYHAMNEASKRLLHTITQILDISRLETKDFEIILKTLSVKRAVLSNINLIKQSAAAKGLTIKLDIPEHDVYVKADEYCLNGVLLNILSNAIKYSERGEIEVKISENGRYVYCNITDYGIGMSEEYQKHLFETFSQEDTGASRRYEGTGLGLAITKKYLQIMNGDIKIESKKNDNTKVTFWLEKDYLI